MGESKLRESEVYRLVPEWDYMTDREKLTFLEHWIDEETIYQEAVANGMLKDEDLQAQIRRNPLPPPQLHRNRRWRFRWSDRLPMSARHILLRCPCSCSASRTHTGRKPSSRISWLPGSYVSASWIKNLLYHQFLIIFRTIYWHSSIPAEAVTQQSEPGTLLLPGGGVSTCSGCIGSSGENTTG